MNVHDNVTLASAQMLLTFTVILFVCSKVLKEVKIRKCECGCVWNHLLNEHDAFFLLPMSGGVSAECVRQREKVVKICELAGCKFSSNWAAGILLIKNAY